MPHLYCPCGGLLTGSSTIRSLKPPCLRFFISIRTMKSVSPEEKVCNACRTAYYIWKTNNPEFGNIFSRIEQESSDVEQMMDVKAVNEKKFFFLLMHIYIYTCLYFFLPFKGTPPPLFELF